MKHAVTIAIVFAWLVMVGLLVARQHPPAAIDVASLPPGLEARSHEEWFGVYQGGRKIGHSRRQTARTPDGYRLEDETSLLLAMLGSPQPFSTWLVAHTDDTFALRRFEFALTSPAARFVATGTSDDHRLDIRRGDGGAPIVVPLAAPVRLPFSVRPRVAAARPADGTRVRYEAFSPLTLRNEAVTVIVEGHETIGGRDALRVSEEHQGLRGRAWLAEDGTVLREEAALGFVLRREERETALTGIDAKALIDLPVAMRIPVDGPITAPRTRTTLALRVTGAAAGSVPADPPRQELHDGVIRIRREAIPSGPASGPVPTTDLAPSPFIESDDAAIVDQARSIVGDETDPAMRAKRLVGWVHDTMVAEPRVTVPSAREVLRSRRGDCNEHAVLLAALARAAGIPARVVVGAVYLDDGFYYHAWNALWIGDWVTADAVFDQLPVDATHVTLLVGGPERQLELAGMVGGLAFTAVESGS